MGAVMTIGVSSADRPQIRAIVALFVANGALFGVVAPRLPEFVARLEIGPGLLGVIFGVASGGSLVGTVYAPTLVRRYGPKNTLRLFLTLAAVGGIVATVAVVPGAVVVGFALLGLCDGLIDVATNQAAVELDRRRVNQLMSRFHASWALGVLFFSVVSVATTSLVSLPVLAVVVTLATTALAFLATADLAETPVRDNGQRRRFPVRLLVGAVSIATVGTLVESIPIDWGALAMEERFEGGATIAGLAVTIALGGAIVARLLGDRMIAIWGAKRAVSAMMVPALAGMLLIAAGGSAGLALVGFGLAGFGAGLLFPGLITVASSVENVDSGQAVGAIVGASRLALMVGPPLVGLVAERSGMVGAFWIAASAALILVAWGSWNPR